MVRLHFHQSGDSLLFQGLTVRSSRNYLTLCTALLKKSIRAGLIVVGEINLGGSIETIHNAVSIVEIAIEKGASVILMPVSSRKQLFDLSDDMATKIDVQFYSDARDSIIKAIAD